MIRLTQIGLYIADLMGEGSQDTVCSQGEGSFIPGEDMYNEMMPPGQNVSIEHASQFVSLLQHLTLAYIHFYDLINLAHNICHSDSSTPDGSTGMHPKRSSHLVAVTNTKNSAGLGQVRNWKMSKLVDSPTRSEQKLTVMLEDILHLHDMKRHVKGLERHLVRITGKKQLNFCQMALLQFACLTL